MYEAICDALHREMDEMEEKYSSGKAAMNREDLDMIDKMAHALKSIATYKAMVEGERSRTRRYYEPRDEYRRY